MKQVQQPSRKFPVETAVYAVGALLLLGPLLLPGFVLTLDMVFTPKLRPPSTVTSGYLWQGLLHGLGQVLSADAVQKLVLFGALFLAGLGMHWLVRKLGKPHWASPYFAGLLYMINPFTYERFMAGQYNVLFGYALLPWLLRALLRLARQPDWRRTALAAAWAIAISVVSIHSIVPVIILAAAVMARQLWQERHTPQRQWRLVRYSLVLAVVWLAASSYWIAPALAGTGPQAESVSSFTNGDRLAFATSGDGALERLGYVAHLQGFWAERHGLFILPQHGVPGWLWWVVTGVVWGLVLGGMIAWWRSGRRTDTAAFSMVIVAGGLLATGIGGGWLAEHIPYFAGYREPQKFAMLVALGYAVLAAAGLAAALRRLERRPNIKAWSGVAAGLLLSIPFIWTPTYAWAAKGQLQAVQYPSDWQIVNERLNADHTDFHTLFLPWHMYLYTNFAGRVIANPAQKYFDKPVIISDNPELDGAARGQGTAAIRRIDVALQQAKKGGTNLVGTLTALDIKYVLLAKDSDFETYTYLSRQAQLTKIMDLPAITLYRNQAYKD